MKIRADEDPRWKSSFGLVPVVPKHSSLVLICARCGAHRVHALERFKRACGNCGGQVWEERWK